VWFNVSDYRVVFFRPCEAHVLVTARNIANIIRYQPDLGVER